MKMFASLRCLLLATGAAAAVWWTPGAEAAPTSKLTLPFFQPNIAVNSWLDHTSPAVTGLYSDNNPTVMKRYDGTTGWSYNGQRGGRLQSGGEFPRCRVPIRASLVSSGGRTRAISVRAWDSMCACGTRRLGTPLVYAHLLENYVALGWAKHLRRNVSRIQREYGVFHRPPPALRRQQLPVGLDPD